MKYNAIRFISEAEKQALETEGKVEYKHGFYSWSNKKVLYAFAINNYYKIENYIPLVNAMEIFSKDTYQYVVYLNLPEDGWTNRPYLAPYDTYAFEGLPEKEKELLSVFDIDEEAYDTGAVYLAPEYRIKFYTKDQVVEIKPIEEVRNTIKESGGQMEKRFRRVYVMVNGKKEYAHYPIVYGWETTTDIDKAKVFDLEDKGDKASHDFLMGMKNTVSEVVTKNEEQKNRRKKMKKDSILSENKGGRETIEDIRANLYIADEAYDELWNEWEHDIVKAVRKYELDKDIIYVFESDLQHEVDYLDEEGYSMEIVDNVDGLIFYKTLPKQKETGIPVKEWKKVVAENAEERDAAAKEAFNKIGKVIADSIGNVDAIYLDDVKGQTFIVVEFRGGAISVRNASANSLTANLEELTKLLNGGYYKEVDYYNKLKEESLKETKTLKESFEVGSEYFGTLAAFLYVINPENENEEMLYEVILTDTKENRPNYLDVFEISIDVPETTPAYVIEEKIVEGLNSQLDPNFHKIKVLWVDINHTSVQSFLDICYEDEEGEEFIDSLFKVDEDITDAFDERDIKDMFR